VIVVLLWWSTAGPDVETSLWHRYQTLTAAINVAGSVILIAAGYILGSPADRTARFFQVARLAMSVLILFTLLELPVLVSGFDYGVALGTHENDTWLQLATRVNLLDADLIHIHSPHTHYQGIVSGNLARLGIPSPARYAVDVAYDHNGFRNDVDFTHADIVAIGDSFVEGAEVSQQETVVAQIGRTLGVSIANLGQSNYGPQQELVVLQRYGAPLLPKVVVWFMFGGNDLSDAGSYEWRRQHLATLVGPPSVSMRSFSRNALIAFARLTTPKRRVASPTARRQSAVFEDSEEGPIVLYLDAPEGPWRPKQWETTASALLRAREVTAKMGAEFLVVYIPRKLRVYRGFLRADPDSVAQTWPLNDLPRVVADWCREHGVGFLDSTLALRKAVASGTSVYLADDVHWNAAGHAVVAGAVAEWIRAMATLLQGSEGSVK
jgi:lysophospholipase L1-like esterase